MSLEPSSDPPKVNFTNLYSDIRKALPWHEFTLKAKLKNYEKLTELKNNEKLTKHDIRKIADKIVIQKGEDNTITFKGQDSWFTKAIRYLRKGLKTTDVTDYTSVMKSVRDAAGQLRQEEISNSTRCLFSIVNMIIVNAERSEGRAIDWGEKSVRVVAASESPIATVAHDVIAVAAADTPAAITTVTSTDISGVPRVLTPRISVSEEDHPAEQRLHDDHVVTGTSPPVRLSDATTEHREALAPSGPETPDQLTSTIQQTSKVPEPTKPIGSPVTQTVVRTQAPPAVIVTKRLPEETPSYKTLKMFTDERGKITADTIKKKLKDLGIEREFGSVETGLIGTSDVKGWFKSIRNHENAIRMNGGEINEKKLKELLSKKDDKGFISEDEIKQFVNNIKWRIPLSDSFKANQAAEYEFNILMDQKDCYIKRGEKKFLNAAAIAMYFRDPEEFFRRVPVVPEGRKEDFLYEPAPAPSVSLHPVTPRDSASEPVSLQVAPLPVPVTQTAVDASTINRQKTLTTPVRLEEQVVPHDEAKPMVITPDVVEVSSEPRQDVQVTSATTEALRDASVSVLHTAETPLDASTYVADASRKTPSLATRTPAPSVVSVTQQDPIKQTPSYKTFHFLAGKDGLITADSIIAKLKDIHPLSKKITLAITIAFPLAGKGTAKAWVDGMAVGADSIRKRDGGINELALEKLLKCAKDDKDFLTEKDIEKFLKDLKGKNAPKQVRRLAKYDLKFLMMLAGEEVKMSLFTTVNQIKKADIILYYKDPDAFFRQVKMRNFPDQV